MRKTTKAAWLAVPLAGFLFLAACGDDSDSSSATTGGGAATTGGGAATTGGGAATTGASGRRRDIARRRLPRHRRSCRPTGTPRPSTAACTSSSVPTPRSTPNTKAVTGELMASGGVDTGVKIEVRVGGPAIGFQQVTAQLYTDDSILLGYVSNDEAVQNSADKPDDRARWRP